MRKIILYQRRKWKSLLFQNKYIHIVPTVKVKVSLVSEWAYSYCANGGDGDACGYWGGGQNHDAMMMMQRWWWWCYDDDDGDDDDALVMMKMVMMMVMMKVMMMMCNSRRGVQGDIPARWKQTTSRSLAHRWGVNITSKF